jgi:methylated-DNA-[protein]-cysteine S-methyltransferase
MTRIAQAKGAAVPDPIHFLSVPSTLGELFLATAEEGLCRIAWESSEAAFSAELAGVWERPVCRLRTGESDLLDRTCRQLSEYLQGRRRAFDLPLDLSLMTPFQRRVLSALLQVPFGEVVSYGQLAALAGYHGAARAVGGVMRANPLAIVVPCHRVVLSSGELGGFGGRPDLKRRLLALEGWGKEP